MLKYINLDAVSVSIFIFAKKNKGYASSFSKRI